MKEIAMRAERGLPAPAAPEKASSSPAKDEKPSDEEDPAKDDESVPEKEVAHV